MPRPSLLSTVFSFALGVLLWIGLPSPAQGQSLQDVVRYSARSPAGGGPVAGRAGAGLSAGLAAPDALFRNPAGLGWLSSSMLSGDLATNVTQTDTRFVSPGPTGSADQTVSDYRLGSLAGAYSFPTTQGSLVIGVSVHQSNAYERGFDVPATNGENSITETFLPAEGDYEFDPDEGALFFDDNARLSQIAYEAGAIDFSRDRFDDGTRPFFFPGADPRDSTVADQLTLEQQENLTESGQMNELSFGVGTAIAPNIMLGGGLNIAFGSYTFERFYRETDVGNGQTNQVCSSPGLCPPADPADPERPYDPYLATDLNGDILLEGFDEMQLERRVDTDLAGVNFRIGLSAEPAEALRVGTHVSSPTWLNIDEVFGTEIRTFFDCDFSTGSCVRPEEPFSSGNLTGNEFSYDIRTPWRLGGGFQYSLGSVALAGGATFIDWTQAEVSTEDGNSSNPNCSAQGLGPIEELNCDIQGLDPTVNTRAGLEYETESFVLRTGVAYQPSPTDQSFQDIDGTTADGDRLSLSAGASVSLGPSSTLHFNWLQERFDDRFVSYSSDRGTSPTVREALQRNRVLVGFTYRP